MSQIREPCYFYTQKAESYIKGGDYEVKHNPVVFVVFSEDFYPLDDDKYQSCLCRSLNLANEYNIDVSYSDKEDLAKAIYFDLSGEERQALSLFKQSSLLFISEVFGSEEIHIYKQEQLNELTSLVTSIRLSA